MVKKKNKNYLRLVSSVMLLGVIVLSVLILGVRLLGYQTFPVLDDDMAPTYRLGSLAYVKKVELSEIQSGSVISFRMGDGTAVSMQRVEKVLEGGQSFLTGVDKRSSMVSNEVLLDNVIGVPSFSIPVIGYFAVLARDTTGFLFIGLFFVLLAGLNFYGYLFHKFRNRKH